MRPDEFAQHLNGWEREQELAKEHLQSILQCVCGCLHCIVGRNAEEFGAKNLSGCLKLYNLLFSTTDQFFLKDRVRRLTYVKHACMKCMKAPEEKLACTCICELKVVLAVTAICVVHVT
jgi:hypothetical protein